MRGTLVREEALRVDDDRIFSMDRSYFILILGSANINGTAMV